MRLIIIIIIIISSSSSSSIIIWNIWVRKLPSSLGQEFENFVEEPFFADWRTL